MNQENKQTGSRYPLFEHMVDEYGLHLLDSQIDDITLIAAEINGIKSLREELEKLRAENERFKLHFESYYHSNLKLEGQNQKLREALEGLYNYTKNHRDLKGYIKFEYLLGKAKEALKVKGGSDE